MKRKLSTRLICLIISGVLLSGALTVAALNGSPYETLKNAFFNALTYENFRLEGEMRLTIDGELIESESVSMVVSENGSIEMENDRLVSFTHDSLRVRHSYKAQDGTQWYSARIDRWNDNPWAQFTPEDRQSAQFRFAELFVDILVGDLKSNMYMTTNSGVRRISGAITHNQLPELVRVGIEMMIESQRSWMERDYGSRDDFRNPSEIPIRSLIFDHIGGEAYIDNMGNLTYLNANVIASVVNVFGDNHVFEFSIVADFSDIGTTVVENLIPGASELLTPEFIESISGWRYSTVHFTRLEDGSIDPDSIIDTWPGNLRNQENLVVPASDWCFDDACDWDIDCGWWDCDLDCEYNFEILFAIVEEIEMLIDEGNYEDALRILLDLDLTDSDLICAPFFDYLVELTMELSYLADMLELSAEL